MHGPLNVKFDRNLLVKNDMWSNIFVNVHLLVYHVTIKHSLMNGNEHTKFIVKPVLNVTWSWRKCSGKRIHFPGSGVPRIHTSSTSTKRDLRTTEKKNCQSFAVRFQAGFTVCINNCHLSVYPPSGLFHSDTTAKILHAFIISWVLQPCHFIFFKFYSIHLTEFVHGTG